MLVSCESGTSENCAARSIINFHHFSHHQRNHCIFQIITSNPANVKRRCCSSFNLHITLQNRQNLANQKNSAMPSINMGNREIVNGNILQIFNGQKVSVTGVITKVQPGGLSFDMRTVDSVDIKVKLTRSLSGVMLGLAEVHGIARGNSIIGEEVNNFGEEYAKDFDVASHNQLCIMYHSLRNEM